MTGPRDKPWQHDVDNVFNQAGNLETPEIERQLRDNNFSIEQLKELFHDAFLTRIGHFSADREWEKDFRGQLRQDWFLWIQFLGYDTWTNEDWEAWRAMMGYTE